MLCWCWRTLPHILGVSKVPTYLVYRVFLYILGEVVGSKAFSLTAHRFVRVREQQRVAYNRRAAFLRQFVLNWCGESFFHEYFGGGSR